MLDDYFGNHPSLVFRESMDVQTMAAAQLTLWKDKIEKAFFRGRDSRKERLELVRLSKRHPNIIDAGLTNYFFFRKGEEEELGKAERVSMLKFHDYKYQISIDGTVAAYRYVHTIKYTLTLLTLWT